MAAVAAGAARAAAASRRAVGRLVVKQADVAGAQAATARMMALLMLG